MLRSDQFFTDAQLLNILSKSLTATAIYTGEDIVIRAVNEAMLRFWGRDNSIIGLPLGSAVPELNEQPFINILKNVWYTGETYQAREVAAELLIGGQLQTSYFDFTYQALRNAEGGTYCILHTAADVTEKVKSKLAITETQEQLRMAIDSADLGTWTIDVKTRQLTPSGRFKELYGYYNHETMPDEAALGQIADEYRGNVNQAIDAAIEKNEDFKVEYPIVRKHDKKQMWLRATGRLYRDNNSRPTHIAGVLINITDQKQEIAQQNDFIAMASHELKTPVTSIKGLAQVMELMLRKEGNFKMADMMIKLQSQVQRLISLISDLLDITKLQAGKLQFEEEYFDFNSIVIDSIEEMQRTTHRHDIISNLNFHGKVFGDKERIRQVIINFMSNAIKYSPDADSIIVNTSVNSGFVELCVKDFGIGIERHHLKRIFEQFYRVTGSSEKKFKGLGLGLYISSTIIERSGGKIWADSTVGNGSTFCFSLPVTL